MVRLQIIHLLPPHHGPNVFAQKLNNVKLMVVDIAHAGHDDAASRTTTSTGPSSTGTAVQEARGVEARPVTRESFRQTFADPEAQAFQPHVNRVGEDVRAGQAVSGDEGGCRGDGVCC